MFVWPLFCFDDKADLVDRKIEDKQVKTSVSTTDVNLSQSQFYTRDFLFST